jgi:hypothetical protein
LAAEKSGDKQKAALYYKQLSTMIDITNCDRPEIANMRGFFAIR